MAHKLDRERTPEPQVSSADEVTNETGKLPLNRRTLVKVGIAGTAAFLSGTSMTAVADSDESSTTVYWTDFSEGVL